MQNQIILIKYIIDTAYDISINNFSYKCGEIVIQGYNHCNVVSI